MSPQYPSGSEGWREARDYSREVQAQIAAERFRQLQSEKEEEFKQEFPERQPRKTAEQLAKERAEFKEMMEAKRQAKQAARVAEEKANIGQHAVVESSPTGFVYFVRNGGLFKIGITENMLWRMGELTPDELLNVVRCSNFQEVERELHRRFKNVRLPQTEYFRLSDQQVQEVHLLMVQLAQFPSK